MSEELECHNLDVPKSRNQQIWCRSDLGLQRDKFYATFYAIQQLQRQQQAELKNEAVASVENLFLDRLSLLFARIKTNGRKTPANVTATCLMRHDSRWEVYIAKNDGLQDGNEVSPESEKSFAKKLQDWIREEANHETLFDGDDDSDESSIDEEDESIESIDSEAEPMAIRMANFWKDRVNYYVKGSKDAWDRLNQKRDAKIRVENYFQMQDQNFTEERFYRDWDKAAKLARFLRDRPTDKAITTKFLAKFFRFCNRSGREDWQKPLKSEPREARDFRKCIRYMEMLGMPIIIWEACVRFRKLPEYKTVHLIAIDKPIFDELRLDKNSIINIFKWWATKHNASKVILPRASLESMRIEPELFFHCELQILTLLTSLIHQKRGHYFIGCSKLSCESCWQILKNDAQFTTRGSHHKVSANCAFPFPSKLEPIGRSIRQMQSAWKKMIFSDSIKRSNVQIDDTDQALPRLNALAEGSALDLPFHSSHTNPYKMNLHIKPSEGSFANVYSATKHDQASDNSVSQPHTSYALKVMTITTLEKSKMVRNEIEILRRLQRHSHRNILRLEVAFYWKDRVTIVLATQPYAPLSLEKFFEKAIRYEPEEWHEPRQLLQWPEIVRQCLEGLQFLHAQESQILHRDLKPHNILLWKKEGPNGRVEICPVIADFGISTDLLIETSTHPGTLEYMSPEVLDGAAKTIYSDIWALGCCFAQIFVLLYSGEGSLHELREAIRNSDQRGFSKNLDHVNWMLEQSDGEDLPDELLGVSVFRKTVSRMLDPSPNYRPTTQIALAYHQEFEALLGLIKLNIPGLTINFKFGSKGFARRFDGPNLPSIGDLMIICNQIFEGRRSVMITGIWRLLKIFFKPSIPRLVYLTMPKDNKTHLIHIEDDFPNTLSRKKSKLKTIDSKQPQLHSTNRMQLSDYQESVNDAIQKLWTVDIYSLINWELEHLGGPWAFSLPVFEKISKLSQAWNNAANNSSRKTEDHEYGLEISYHVDIRRTVVYSALIIMCGIFIYMVVIAGINISHPSFLLLFFIAISILYLDRDRMLLEHAGFFTLMFYVGLILLSLVEYFGW